jgi:hypothetical protein
MSLIPGIRSAAYSNANQVVTNSAALVTQTGFTFDIGTNQAVGYQWYIPFSVGASGGVRLQVTSPLLSTINNQVFLLDCVTPFIYGSVVTAINTPYTNALAVAGTHFFRISGVVTSTVNAGTVSFQFAQNTADANSLTFLAGAFLQITNVS